jgi:hypothetical protein
MTIESYFLPDHLRDKHDTKNSDEIINLLMMNRLVAYKLAEQLTSDSPYDRLRVAHWLTTGEDLWDIAAEVEDG